MSNKTLGKYVLIQNEDELLLGELVDYSKNQLRLKNVVRFKKEPEIYEELLLNPESNSKSIYRISPLTIQRCEKLVQTISKIKERLFTIIQETIDNGPDLVGYVRKKIKTK